MNTFKISVIFPVYKVEKYLMQCIDSILNQSLNEIEVILIDEGDIDECRAIIDMYETGIKKDKRIKTIHEKNGGYGASVNKGIDIAKGEYISIIESDDFIKSDMYEKLYSYAKNLNADVVKLPYFEYSDKTSDSNEEILPCFFMDEVKDLPVNKLFSIEEYPILASIHPSFWAAIYKKSYLKEKNIRLLEAKGAGYVDNHFRLQTLCQTNKIAWYNEAFNYYRLTNENASTVLYNVSVFIKRWEDVHKFIREKIPEKWKILAPYCIKEEYANIYSKLYLCGYSITNEDFEIIKNNLENYSIDDIKKSPLHNQAKRLCLAIKKNPDKLKKFINKKVSNNKVLLFGIKLFEIKKIDSRRFWLLLFGIIPLFKYKISVHSIKKLYLFGAIPFMRLQY